MRLWLPTADIPDDNELRDDLTAPEYAFDSKERWVLESKDDMKARGLASPDIGDALAMTFAENVLPTGAGRNNITFGNLSHRSKVRDDGSYREVYSS
jgi:hypothetical protein